MDLERRSRFVRWAQIGAKLVACGPRRSLHGFAGAGSKPVLDIPVRTKAPFAFSRRVLTRGEKIKSALFKENIGTGKLSVKFQINSISPGARLSCSIMQIA